MYSSRRTRLYHCQPKYCCAIPFDLSRRNRGATRVFVDWYSGALDRDAFTRLERTLAPDFELVTPDGNRRDRAAVVSGIHEDYGRDDEGTFSIDIRNVEVVEQMDDFAVVRYEEFQETTDGTTGRISTALFRDDPSAPGGVVWLDLHDTWLDDSSK